MMSVVLRPVRTFWSCSASRNQCVVNPPQLGHQRLLC